TVFAALLVRDGDRDGFKVQHGNTPPAPGGLPARHPVRPPTPTHATPPANCHTTASAMVRARLPRGGVCQPGTTSPATPDRQHRPPPWAGFNVAARRATATPLPSPRRICYPGPRWHYPRGPFEVWPACRNPSRAFQD